MNDIIPIPNAAGAVKTGNGTYDAILARYHATHGALTYDGIKAYMAGLKGKYAATSQAVHKAALKKGVKALYTDLQQRAIIDAAFAEIKTPKPDRVIHREEIITPDEYAAMKRFASDKDRLIMQALYDTGLRVSELCGIEVKRCTVKKEAVFIAITGKGGKERRVFISNELYNAIREAFAGKRYLFETRGGRAYERQYIHFIIKRAGERGTGRTDIHPHSFRHTFATRLLITEKRSITAVSHYMGHSSTAITSDYYIHDEYTPADMMGALA